MSKVELFVDGQKTDYIDLSLTRTVLSPVDSIQFTIIPNFNIANKNLYTGKAKVQTKAEVRIDNQLVFTGCISVLTTESKGNEYSYTFGGRSITCDLIDCSIIPKTYYENDFLKLAKQVVADNGLSSIFNVKADVSLPLLKADPKKDNDESTFTGTKGQKQSIATAKLGQKIYDFLTEYSYKLGIVLQSLPNGDLLLTRESIKSYNSKLINKLFNNSNNILRSKSRLDITNRFHRNIVYGEAGINLDVAGNFSGSENDNALTEAVSLDDVIVKQRKKITLMPSQATQEELEVAAVFQENRLRANSYQYQCTVEGLKSDSGELWEANKLIEVQDDVAQLNGLRLIQEVTYNVSSRGITTDLTLANKGALTLSNAGINSNVPTYGVPNSLIKQST
jgi:prophage tail gpP-like protein